MRAVRALLVGLLTLLALAKCAQAQQPSADPKNPPRHSIGAELTVINRCVREVRRSTRGSDFDARVGSRGAIRYVGTDAEIAAFKRCMETRGFPVDAK